MDWPQSERWMVTTIEVSNGGQGTAGGRLVGDSGGGAGGRRASEGSRGVWEGVTAGSSWGQPGGRRVAAAVGGGWATAGAWRLATHPLFAWLTQPDGCQVHCFSTGFFLLSCDTMAEEEASTDVACLAEGPGGRQVAGPGSTWQQQVARR